VKELSLILKRKLKELSPGSLLSSGLLGLLLVIYIYTIYALVITLGSFPFGNQPTYRLLQGSDYWPLNLIALLCLALTIVPVSRWLHRRVNDLVFAPENDFYTLPVIINQQLREMQNPQLTMPQVAETIAVMLHLRYVALGFGTKSEQRVSFGSPPNQTTLHEFPLHYLNQPLGKLMVSNHTANRPLSPGEHVVLQESAQQIGIALYVAQLTDVLQNAREQLVITREEERRRIRNDLHDGLAPSLSSFQLQLSAIRTFMQQNPPEAEKMIAELAEDMRQATAEIRRLVYDLRPPMLDDLGLVAAIKHIKLPGSSLRLEVTAPEPMPPLPAAAEVAVYRIAGEAIHNVVKHAQATCCTVAIDVEAKTLVLRVSDDGRSFAANHTGGIGLQSMQERAAELGGTFSIHAEENGGTRVEVRLPLEMA
jgi:two-component system NarL family sensor kinase